MKRRTTDKQWQAALGEIFVYADARLTVIVAAAAMLLWLATGLFFKHEDFASHNAQYNIAGFWWWVFAYTFAPCSMIYCALRRFPAGASLATGSFVVIVWMWSFFSRIFNTSGQTGIATSLIMVLVGLLIIQRSGVRRAS